MFDRMLVMAETRPAYRSGFVAVLGKPNVGKSTLMNAILGQKVAAVSHRPQTTRKRQLGILTSPNAQIIFVDTPGVHSPKHKLGGKMVQQAVDTLAECDLILILLDASMPLDSEDHLLAGLIQSTNVRTPYLVVHNKIDRVDPALRLQRREEALQLLPNADLLEISATRGDGLDQLLTEITTRLPENPPFYPEEQVTDLYEKEIAADLIREAALLLLRDEVPHGIAVRIDEYTERGEEGAYIEATLLVERDSHKGIVIGKGGGMLKKIGSVARQNIEQMSGRKVYLRLRVKVQPLWRDDERVLRWFGY